MASSISAEDARRAARNVSALIIASILSKGLLFVWQIILSTWIGPTEYGIFTTVMSLFSIGAVVGSFGIGMIAIREIAKHPERIGQYAGAMLFMQTALGLVGYMVLMVGAVSIGIPEVTAFAAITGISLFIDLFGNLANDLLIAQEQMIITSMIDVVHIILRVFLAWLTLQWGWGLAGIYLATIVSGLIRTTIFWIVLYRRQLRVIFPLDPAIVRPLFINALPIAITSFFSLAYQHADKIMTTTFLGTQDTGYVGVAYLINFGVTELISTTILVAMFPLLSRSYDGGKTETFGFLLEKLARYMLMVALPITLVLTVFARDIILLVFSAEYEQTIGILQIVMWYTLLAMVGNVFVRGLLVQNKQRLTLLVRITSLILNITLNVILLNTMRDPRGAAIASVIAESVTLIALAQLFRAEGFHWNQVLWRSGRVLLVGGAMTGMMLITGQIHFIVGMVVGAIVYLLGIIFGGVLADDDWDLIYRIAMALPFGAIIHRYWKRDVALHW